MSLIYLLPKIKREAASRFFTGLCCGMIFEGPVGLVGGADGDRLPAFRHEDHADGSGGREPFGLAGAWCPSCGWRSVMGEAVGAALSLTAAIASFAAG